MVLGGTLIQHIPDSVPDCLAHEQEELRSQAGHTVAVRENTLLHDIAGIAELPVNSDHHQAEHTVGDGVVRDGVIEGIEHAR